MKLTPILSQSANGSKLVHLHRTSLKNRTSDYVTLLGDLGKEQKFEVTYVEVDEKTDDDQVGSLDSLRPTIVNQGFRKG